MIKIMNENQYPRFIVEDPPEYKSTNRKIKSVRLERVDYEKDFKEQFKSGETFLITNPNPLHTDGRRTNAGIYSPNFGHDLMSNDPQSYSCGCNHLISAINEGKVCPICGNKVKFIEPDLRTMAFIDIAPHHILTYHGYNAMQGIFKAAELNEILNNNKKIDLKGKVIDDDNLNLLSIYENYDEKFEPLTRLPKNLAFTSKIPVFSSVLRPLIKKGNVMTVLDVNKQYESITILAGDLRLISHIKSETQILKNLNQIQQEFIGILDHVISQVGTKHGAFRKYGVSGRVDYSSRLVIKLGPELEAHQIKLPYQTVMVLYEEEIINHLCKIDNISVAKALDLHARAVNKMDEKFKSIINMLINRKNGLWALINRNPTISESGILYMKIVGINDNINDYTMSLPVDVLVLFAADFDGDQLTAIACKNVKYHALFQNSFQPTYMFIDRATGYYNRGMDLKKDYIAIVSKLWDVGKTVEAWNKYPDVNTADRYDMINGGISDYKTALSEGDYMRDLEDGTVNVALNEPLRDMI